MDCHVIKVPQGSDDWDSYRSCRLTASRLGDVMAKPTSKRYIKYRSEMVCELSGIEPDRRDEPWFEHGKEMEPRALAAYAKKYQTAITHDVFLIHHRYQWFGASPDLMTLSFDEGGEIKCRQKYSRYRAIVQNMIDRQKRGDYPVSPESRFQVQGCMWITGFDSWWYINYHDNERTGLRKIHRILVPRDDKLIAQMRTRSIQFMRQCYDMAGLTSKAI